MLGHPQDCFQNLRRFSALRRLTKKCWRLENLETLKTLRIVPIELANALTASRLDNPAGKVKEALSNALWSITSIPEVALYVTQNFDFLQVIIDTIKQGPDSDSETHTGNLRVPPSARFEPRIYGS